MTTDADFLRACLSYPSDPGPRLVYADWLEDRGRKEAADLMRSKTGEGLVRISESAPRIFAEFGKAARLAGLALIQFGQRVARLMEAARANRQ